VHHIASKCSSKSSLSGKFFKKKKIILESDESSQISLQAVEDVKLVQPDVSECVAILDDTSNEIQPTIKPIMLFDHFRFKS